MDRSTGQAGGGHRADHRPEKTLLGDRMTSALSQLLYRAPLNLLHLPSTSALSQLLYRAPLNLLHLPSTAPPLRAASPPR